MDRLQKTVILLFSFLMIHAVDLHAENDSPKSKLRYTVKITGVDSELAAYLLSISDTHARKDQIPAALGILKRRAEADLAQLQDALCARGYYDSKIDLRVSEEPDQTIFTEPYQVIFTIESGPRYFLESLQIEILDQNNFSYLPPKVDALDLITGAPADAERILAAESRLLIHAQEAGYPLAKIAERSVTVNHNTHRMEVILRLNSGPRARFGDVELNGAPGVQNNFLQTLIPWKTDQIYHPQLIEELRQALIATELFSTIRIQLAEHLDINGRIPIQVELAERFHRTFKTSLGYNVTKGPELALGWWHRNYFMSGESISLEGTISGIGYSLDSQYHQPSFWRADQSLVMEGRTVYENTEAYSSTAATVSVGIERHFSRKISATVGPVFRLSRVNDLTISNSENFGLISLPIKVDGDFSNHRLDATNGWRIFLQGAPYVEILKTNLYFSKLLGKYSRYFELLDNRRLIFAGRVSLGGIFGAQRDAIPADERFYAGGGGSIRGYGYQMAGPLTTEGKPLGGASLLELSGETRVAITDTFSGVLFIDSGGAFAQGYPGAGDFLIGTGVGFRYATPIGPFRFDFGVPMKKRNQFDDAFQIYLSIGQAF